MALAVRSRTSIAGRTNVGWSPLTLFAANEQGVWYDPGDFSTLFQDAAGTTPVTAVEQSVGCILDRRNVSYSTYFDGTGDYLTLPTGNPSLALGSGDFTFEAWVYRSSGTGTAVVLNGQGDLANVAGSSYYFNVSSTGTSDLYVGASTTYSITSPNPSTGSWSHVVWVRAGGVYSSYLNGSRVGTRSDLGSASINAGLTTYAPSIGAFATGSAALNGYISNARLVKGVALYDPSQTSITVPTAPLTAISGTSLLTCGNSWSGNPTITRVGDTRADKLNPFNTGTGNHATQSTGTSRPVVSARVNLLTYTEDFSNAIWAPFNSGVSAPAVTPSAALSPAGTMTASKIVFPAVSGAGNGWGLYQQIFSGISPSTNQTQKLWMRGEVGGEKVYLIFVYYNGSNLIWASQLVTLTTSWQNVSQAPTSGTSGTPTWNYYFGVGVDLRPGVNNTMVAQSGGTVYVWGGDLRPANAGVGLPAYQRVNTSTDYDTVGFPFYLKFDGVDDSMSTASASFLSGLSGMSTFAGFSVISAPSLSGAAIFSAGASSTADILYAYDKGGQKFFYQVDNGADGAVVDPATSAFISPYVDALVFDGTKGTATDRITKRRNASPVSLSFDYSPPTTTATLTGPFAIGYYTVSTSNWRLNGNLYSLIIRGALSDANQSANAEAFVNSRTKAY